MLWNIKNLKSKCEKKSMKHSNIDISKVDHKKRLKEKNNSKDRRNTHNSLKNTVVGGLCLELKRSSISRMLLNSKKNVGN